MVQGLGIRLALSTAIVLGCIGGLAGAAQAQAPGFYNHAGAPMPYGAMVPDGSRGMAGEVGGGGNDTLVEGMMSPRIEQPRAKLRKSCRRKRRTRTCRYARGRVLIKVCTSRRRGGKWRKSKCRRARARSALAGATERGRTARASIRLGSGFSNPPFNPVVHFYRNGQPWCSGSMVLRGVVLTAAHCLYGNHVDGNGFLGWYQSSFNLTAAPGSYVNTSYQVVTPNGEWPLYRSWIPPAFINNDGGQDWGIAVIGADANGRFPGDYAGTYNAYWNASIAADARLYNIGYPVDGAFGTDAWFNGHGQYYCDTRREGDIATPDNYTRSSIGMLTNPCEMTGGSSGGPVMTPFSDGSWGIVGVNNRGPRPPPGGFGSYGISFYLDDDFARFWNDAINQVNGGAPSGSAAASP